MVLASHDARARARRSNGYVVLHTGPVLPDVRSRLRQPDRRRHHARQDRTPPPPRSCSSATPTSRSQPEGQIAKVQRSIVEDGGARGAARGASLGLVPLRHLAAARAEPGAGTCSHGVRAGCRLVEVGLALLLVGVLWWAALARTTSRRSSRGSGGPSLGRLPRSRACRCPKQVAGPRGARDVTTEQTRTADRERDRRPTTRARRSTTRAAVDAASLDLRRAGRGRDRGALVADRHDNIGMDAVARRSRDAGRSDGGLQRGRRHVDRQDVGGVQPGLGDHGVRGPTTRYGVAGNHDHGTFVRNYLADHGWTMLDGADARRTRRHHAARRRRPALERPRQLARRDRAQLRRGRQPARRRRLRGRGAAPGRHDPRARRQPRR